MEFRVLGPLEVEEYGRTVAIQGTKPRALLAVLLLHANRVVGTDELIDALWGERPPETAAKVLQTYVSQLRKGLGERSPLVVTRAGGYVLEVAADAVDVHRFERLAEEGRRALAEGRSQEAAVALRAALTLWRGQPLAEFRNEPFAGGELRRLEETRLAAHEDRLDADLGCGRGRELVAELEALVADHPLRERLRGQLMLALYRSGRQADALRVYREGRAVLVEELGLDPGPQLQRLEKAILLQDPSLEPAGGGGSSEDDRTVGPRTALRAAVVVALVAAAVGGALAFALDSGGSPRVVVPPNTVAAIDPRTGKVDAAIAVGVGPGAVALDGDTLWVANTRDLTLSRLDTRSLSLSRTIPVGDYPSDVAVGLGAVWVASGPLGRLIRIDPRLDTASRPAQASATGCGGLVGSVTVGAGSVWLACDLAPDAVRVDPRTGAALPVAYRAGLLTAATGSIVPHFSAVAFGDGVLWIVDRAQDRVTEIDPATNQAVRQVSVGRSPVAVAVGAGSVWVANSGDGTVSRIELGALGRPAPVETIRVGRRPVGVAVGEGAVWVANAGSRTVSRIDPKRSEVAATIALGNPPAAVAAGSGHVWVSVDRS